MRSLVLETIHGLLHTACARGQASPDAVIKATVAGNSTMMHLLLGIPADSIRLAPFITAVNHVPPLTAREVGLGIHPEATVDCLPGVASYVGADISAGALSSGLADSETPVLFGGSFGNYINVEKAVEIGLLPDLAWDRFHFLGNTSVQGAYLALLDRGARARIRDIARRMTYVELSADNTFYEAFTSALFLPHTDLSHFPTVQAALNL